MILKAPGETQFLLEHRAHDYNALIERWHRIAEAAQLEILIFGTADEYQVYALRSAQTPTWNDGIYLSAGIHGDEPAGCLGLVTWAEAHIELLRQRPCLLLPCLNPWGLVYNSRHNEWGQDLNRCFSGPIQPIVLAWKRVIEPASFRVALTLHEDYDATGIYAYELGMDNVELGEPGLEASSAIIPRYPGSDIEGRPCENALIRATDDIEALAQEVHDRENGLPEAIYLRLRHAHLSLTFETPSEYSLYERVQAQVRFIETVLERAFSR